jgi:hypothetical protein
MIIKATSNDDGFGIFKEIANQCFDVVNSNKIKLFMLETENKLFNYHELYEYILNNVVMYVYDRRKVSTANKSSEKYLIFNKAVDHLRSVENKKDRGAGAELGEILLYLFLEHDLEAPKLFSKVELKTNAEDYIKGSDAIHFKFRKTDEGKTVIQLVVGEAKIYGKINAALSEAFDSINSYLNDHKQDYFLFDTHLLNQFVDEEEADEIKTYFLQRPRPKRETVFGIFIGYTSPYKGENDDNDTYDNNIIDKNKKLVLSMQQTIIDKINEFNISNYQFNFYFLPFHDAPKDRRHIIKLLKEKASVYTDKGRD